MEICFGDLKLKKQGRGFKPVTPNAWCDVVWIVEIAAF